MSVFMASNHGKQVYDVRGLGFVPESLITRKKLYRFITDTAYPGIHGILDKPKKQEENDYEKAFQVMAGIFGVLAVILFVVSIQEVGTGKYTIQVANIPATVFAAAAAIACIINIAGAMIVSSIESEAAKSNKDIRKCLNMLGEMAILHTDTTTDGQITGMVKRHPQPVGEDGPVLTPEEREEKKALLKNDILFDQHPSLKSFYEYVRICDSATDIMELWKKLPSPKMLNIPLSRKKSNMLSNCRNHPVSEEEM